MSHSSDDHEVDIDAVWERIIARWDDEAPPRDPPVTGASAREPASDEEVDLRGRRQNRADFEPSAPAPDDDAHEQPPPAGTAPGPRDVDPLGPSFLDGIGADDDEHYVPPEPPPIPRPSLVTGLAWSAAVGGPLFLVFCAMFWRSAPSLVVAGAVAAFAGGFVTLVLRMSENDTDDGAVV